MYRFSALLDPGFRETVHRVFGDTDADKWFSSLDDTMAACIKKWNLTDCRLSPSLSMNLICFAESPDFGSVSLKVGIPNPEMFTEMDALAAYSGKYACRLFASDRELGAILEERLVPGAELWSLADLGQRIDIAGNLMKNLPVIIDKPHCFPTFGDLQQRAFARARAEGKVGSAMLRFMEISEELFDDLSRQGQPEVLLHGDLHHGNILQDHNSSWKAIDPKGIIGYRSQETARFMENQIGDDNNTEALEELCTMASAFAGYIGAAEDIIAKSAFIDQVLSSVWTFEENGDPADRIDEANSKCQLFYDFMKRFY